MLKIKGSFVVRNIDGELIAMPVGETIRQFGGTVMLNDVSEFIWTKLQNPTTREALLQSILEEYDVSRDVAEADLEAFLRLLHAKGLLTDDDA